MSSPFIFLTCNLQSGLQTLCHELSHVENVLFTCENVKPATLFASPRSTFYSVDLYTFNVFTHMYSIYCVGMIRDQLYSKHGIQQTTQLIRKVF